MYTHNILNLRKLDIKKYILKAEIEFYHKLYFKFIISFRNLGRITSYF